MTDEEAREQSKMIFAKAWGLLVVYHMEAPEGAPSFLNKYTRQWVRHEMGKLGMPNGWEEVGGIEAFKAFFTNKMGK